MVGYHVTLFLVSAVGNPFPQFPLNYPDLITLIVTVMAIVRIIRQFVESKGAHQSPQFDSFSHSFLLAHCEAAVHRESIMRDAKSRFIAMVSHGTHYSL